MSQQHINKCTAEYKVGVLFAISEFSYEKESNEASKTKEAGEEIDEGRFNA